MLSPTNRSPLRLDRRALLAASWRFVAGAVLVVLLGRALLSWFDTDQVVLDGFQLGLIVLCVLTLLVGDRRRPLLQPAPAPTPADEERRQRELEAMAGHRGAPSLLVLLLRPAALDRGRLARAARRVIPATPGVTGRSPLYLVSLGQQLFFVHEQDRPYWDDVEEAARRVDDPMVADAIRSHVAWLGVDMHVAAGGPEGPAAGQRRLAQVARLLGELLDADAAVLLCQPETQAVRLLDGDAIDRLRGPDPLALLRPPTLPVSARGPEDDDALAEARREARRRWPEFARRHRRRGPGQSFHVRAPFGERGRTEHLWVSVEAIQGDDLFGRLDRDPLTLTGLRGGDLVQVAASEIGDWCVLEGDRVHGGFSFRALRAHEDEAL